MTSADKGFFLSYLGDPLSKTAHSGHGMEKESDKPRISSRINWNAHREGKERYAIAGSVGALTGTGISLLWGKLSDKPDIRRDLFMMLAGGVGGVAGEVVRGFRRHTTEHHDHRQKNSYEVPGFAAAKKKAQAAKKKAQELWELYQLGGGDSSQEELTTPELTTPELTTPKKTTPKKTTPKKTTPKKTSLKDKLDAAKNAIQKGFGLQTRGLVGGAAGAATGAGLSALYGKISDNPNIRRDLLMAVLGGAAGVGVGMQWPQISKWYNKKEL